MMESKETLRRCYKNLCDTLSEKRRREAKRAAAKIECTNAGPVLSFASLPHEIDTSKLNCRLLLEGQLVLPAVANNQIICRRVDDLGDLTRGRFGILEPVGAPVDPGEIAFAFIPGLVFDALGGRIGHGFGFYDRLLPNLKRKVGLCFKEQLRQDRIPSDPWDVPVDSVIAL